jgi:Tfp pilus assembly protein PilO
MRGSGPLTQWRRRLVRPLLGLLALNLALLLAFTLPRLLEERGLERSRAALGGEAERERAAVARLRERAETMRRNAADTRRFYSEIVPAEGELVAVLRELDKAALSTGNRSFKPEPVKGASLERFVVTMPMSGSYEQLVAFLRRLESFPRFVTVDRLSLRQNEAGAGLDVVVSAYYQPVRRAP